MTSKRASQAVRTVALRATVVLVILVVTLSACSGLSRSADPQLPLPTAPADLQLCLGLGHAGATLHGDPERPGLTWLDVGGGQEREVLWPPGYTARFTPKLEVLDAAGRTVLTEGAILTGMCAGPDGTLILRPPFR